MFDGYMNYKWPSSTAVLVYQRVSMFGISAKLGVASLGLLPFANKNWLASPAKMEELPTV